MKAALAETAAAVPQARAPEAARVVLRATDLEGGPEVTAGLTWTVGQAGSAPVFERANTGAVETDIPPGDYGVTVRDSGGRTGSAKLEARAGSERTVTIPLALELAASLTPAPPNSAPAGAAVAVQWTGPNRNGDYITVVKPGAAVQEYLHYEDTRLGNPLSLKMPAEPGDYELRYVLARPPRVLAAVPFKVTTVAATITGPSTAVAGSDVTIAWDGPNYSGDWVTVVSPDAPEASYTAYIDANREARLLGMPVEPGAYEFRYVQGGRKILARAPITVTAASAEITAPTSVAAGASFDVSWTGPNNRSDWLTIISSGAPPNAHGSYVDADRGSPAKLTAPGAAGPYELRYVLKGKKVIATRPIDVTAAP